MGTNGRSRREVLRARWVDELRGVRWDSYETCFGTPAELPRHLRALLDDDPEIARTANNALWSALCFGDEPVASAALPALPFLLQALDLDDRARTIEVLDILLALARGTSEDGPLWARRVREALREQRPLLTSATAHPYAEVQHFAELVLAELDRT